MPEYGSEFDTGENEKKEEEWDVTDEIDEETPENVISKLKGYKKITDEISENFPKDHIKQKLVKHSKDVIEGFLDNIQVDIPKEKEIHIPPQMDLTEFIGNESAFIKKGHPGFNEVNQNTHKFGYKHLVYYMKCKLDEFHDLPYIGYTKALNSRLSWHIRDGIRERLGRNKTYINQAIGVAISKELEQIKGKVEELASEMIYEDFNIGDIENFLKNTPSATLNKFYEFMKEEVLKKHFEFEIWEYHKEKNSALAREKDYTQTHPHYIEGKKLNGTIWPNGLNARAGGSAGSPINREDIPTIDYAALVSLGYKHEQIINILNCEYKEPLPSSTVSTYISQEFGSSDKLQERVLKPVVEKLIKDSEDFPLYTIADAVNMDVSTLGEYKLPEWYNGNKFFELKALIKAGQLDWENIKESSPEDAKILRGFTVNQWIDWLVDDKYNMDKLANKVKVSKGWLYRKKYVRKLSTRIYGKE